MPTPLETRIKNIQKNIRVPQTMTFDAATCNALAALMKLTISPELSLLEHKKAIQRYLGFTGRAIDGVMGVNTVTRIENFVSTLLPALPQGGNMIVSKRSLDIIIASEVSSKAMYERKYHKPTWPGNAESGATIGIGYDLGYANQAQFSADWQAHLNATTYNKLKGALGKTGNNARNFINASLSTVSVPWDAAIEVFYTRSMPKYAKDTQKIWPGIELLPPDAQGALLSIVYNRGASLSGPRRTEMKNIVQWVAEGNLKKIAQEIRNMKRLWQGQGLDGLLKRREDEAKLVENATFFLLPEEYVIV